MEMRSTRTPSGPLTFGHKTPCVIAIHPVYDHFTVKGANQMDKLNSAVDFRPRSRMLAMGGIAWLPRITDKARAKLRGTIGDYVYP